MSSRSDGIILTPSIETEFSAKIFFVWLYKVLIAASVGLIALGGATRAMNAGLSCPDWPLCFWQVIPDVHYEVYYEFLHRVLAGIVGLLVIGIQGFLLFHPRTTKLTKLVAVLSILILFVQIVLGALTVLQLLKSSVVTLHLACGVGLFSLLLWNYWSATDSLGAKNNETLPEPKVLIENSATRKNDDGFWIPLKFWSVGLFLCIFAQIILGGLVSTNYAGLACPDFPLCLGSWIPTLQGLIGLHVLHRFGAYFVFALVLTNFWFNRQSPLYSQNSRWLLGLVLVQILLGIGNIVFRIPPLVTILHLVVGVTILGTAMRQMRMSFST